MTYQYQTPQALKRRLTTFRGALTHQVDETLYLGSRGLSATLCGIHVETDRTQREKEAIIDCSTCLERSDRA